MSARQPKLGAKGYCLNCGLAIVVTRVRTGREWMGPFWRNAWVHTHNDTVACRWVATPKPHRANSRVK